MVLRLTGNVDGRTVLFHQGEEGVWHGTVPLDLDGTYVIDLLAVDEAGNSSYYATVLFTVDPERLHMAMLFLKYRLKPVQRCFSVSSVQKPFLKRQALSYGLLPKSHDYTIEGGHQCELQQ